jgi:hypothetical protein
MMTAEERQTALDNLYKIRAVMALIAAEKDKCDKINAYYDRHISSEKEGSKACDCVKERKRIEKKIIANECRQIYDNVKNNCCATLNVEDWKYIDLVIYYLYFGICDSVEDALEQINLLLLSGEFEKRVKCVSDRVCKSVNNNSPAHIQQLSDELGLNKLIKHNALLAKYACNSMQLWAAINYFDFTA